jgi:hypothetical protein
MQQPKVGPADSPEAGRGPQEEGAQDQPRNGPATSQKNGYSLRGNRKRFTGPSHPDRDKQFRYISQLRDEFLSAGDPVISVDTKKKELIGNFKNAGRTWRQIPDEVNAHDFLSDAECRAVPYGIYDLAANRGFVSVGTSKDTPEFAADNIARWWRTDGVKRYPQAQRLLIHADTGGSNAAASRVFKVRLKEKLVDTHGVAVTLCHYPTGASKWNPIEHRLFSRISTNWAGTPLRSLNGMLAALRGTVTKAGLKVRALLNRKQYQAGVKVTNDELAELGLQRHKVCPNWNYTIPVQSMG